MLLNVSLCPPKQSPRKHPSCSVPGEVSLVNNYSGIVRQLGYFVLVCVKDGGRRGMSEAGGMRVEGGWKVMR